MKPATPEENPRLWQVMATHHAPLKPPYPAEMAVTPLSKFGDDTWAYPLTWASLNNRARLVRNHTAKVFFADRSSGSLDPVADPVLVTQLKEACWAASHRRDLLDEHRTPSIPKPLHEHAIHRRYRRLLAAFKRLGCSTLADVQQAELEEALRILGPSQGQFIELASSFESLLQFSKNDLITDGVNCSEFELTGTATVSDDSGVRGLQPLTDEEAGSLIRISLTYIDLASEIAGKIAILRETPDKTSNVLAWARRRLPCGPRLQRATLLQTLLSLVQVSAANLISYHTGLRVSELLSILTGFASREDTETTLDIKRLTIEFTRYKRIRSHFGKRTRLAVHPMIAETAQALETVAQAVGSTGPHLFTPAGDSLPYVTNTWNYYLQRFCDLHSLEIRISSHRWRETVASIAVRILTGSALYLKELFGHVSLATTARYMFASPFIRDEIGDLLLDTYRKREKSLLDSLSVFGGPGLGGRQGKQWETQFRKLSLDRDVTEHDLRKSQEEFLEEMMKQGVFPIPVMPGVFCVAQTTARGECSRTSRDRMPDTGRCSAMCPFQVQEAHRRDNIVATVRKFAQARATRSPLEQRYWAHQIRDQLQAWPELEQILSDVIAEWPELKEVIKGDG